MGVGRSLGDELRWKEDWEVAGCKGYGGGADEREWLQAKAVG